MTDLEQELQRLQEDSQNYHRVMGCLRDLQLEHGLCKPRSRMACTHCNARDELDRLLAAYRGPRIVLAGGR